MKNSYKNIVNMLKISFYAAYERMIEEENLDSNRTALKLEAIKLVSEELECPSNVLDAICENINFPAITFEYESMDIINPFFDETGRTRVEPILYYGDLYSELMINFHSEKLDFLLQDTNFEVIILQTSEYYEDDEDSEYNDKAMFEAYIQNKEDEEEVLDSMTGRYCSVSDVIEEVTANVEFLLENLSKGVVSC